MSNAVRNLEPQSLWNHFADLNAVPRASKKEERVRQFMVDFGSRLGLPTQVDEVGNVIMKKKATAGMEDRQTIALQSHLDMVHQKNADTQFDFDTEGIKMIVDEDWVKADGTTLGADNGIGVATIMALLASDDIPHPNIEALFTIDEETGMTGALGLQGGLLDATILLNLDTEDDHELTIGCAGGIDITASGNYNTIPTVDNSVAFKLSVTGAAGGHSGMEIHLGKANANKVMNRLILEASHSCKVSINEIDGGGLRNAIPRESFSICVVAQSDKDIFINTINALSKVINEEYAVTDPSIKISLDAVDVPEVVADPSLIYKMVRSIYACPNGIYRMSPDIEGLVQTSNNLARVLVKEGKYEMLCLTRSSVDSEKMDLAQAIASSFELMGAKISTGGSYPGWTPKPSAPIIKMMADLYRSKFNGEPDVNACHAGLECGILGTNYPDMDMISFGPNIRGAHSPDEKVQISSVQKYWSYFLEVIQQIPKS